MTGTSVCETEKDGYTLASRNETCDLESITKG